MTKIEKTKQPLSPLSARRALSEQSPYWSQSILESDPWSHQFISLGFIADIVRFLIESKVRVFPAEERWLLRGLKSKAQNEQFHVSGKAIFNQQFCVIDFWPRSHQSICLPSFASYLLIFPHSINVTLCGSVDDRHPLHHFSIFTPRFCSRSFYAFHGFKWCIRYLRLYINK